MMARSTFASVADRLRHRPEWIETDGDREVLVLGYSILDSLLALLVGLIVVAATVAMLAVMP